MTVQMNGRTLDWLSEHDDHSKAHPVRRTTQTPPRSYTWGCDVWLDQGSEGACVGFSWAQELAARPVVIPSVTDTLALSIYHQAQALDGFPDDTEGSSVIAGAKAVQRAGDMDGYRWAFSVSDLAWGIGREGPAVLGINWHESMWEPDATGLAQVAGAVVGGHAILCRGVSLSRREFLLRNSWGRGWGLDGDVRVSFTGMEALLADTGEACFPVRRHQPLRVAR